MDRKTESHLPTLRKDDASAYAAIAKVFSTGQTAIREIPSETVLDVIGARLETIMRDHGIKNKPDKETVMKIFRMIRYNYADLTPEEIELASDLLLLGRISIGDYKHFGDLTLVFITKLLNAYKNHKAHVLEPMYRKEENKKRLRSLQDKQKLFKEIIENIESCYIKYITDDKRIYGNFYNPFAYDFLDRYGIIKLSNAEKDVIAEQAKVLLHEAALKERKDYPSELAFNSYLQALSGGSELKWKCKEIALLQYFEQLKKDGHTSIIPILQLKETDYVRNAE